MCHSHRAEPHSTPANIYYALNHRKLFSRNLLLIRTHPVPAARKPLPKLPDAQPRSSIWEALRVVRKALQATLEDPRAGSRAPYPTPSGKTGRKPGAVGI